MEKYAVGWCRTDDKTIKQHSNRTFECCFIVSAKHFWVLFFQQSTFECWKIDQTMQSEVAVVEDIRQLVLVEELEPVLAHYPRSKAHFDVWLQSLIRCRSPWTHNGEEEGEEKCLLSLDIHSYEWHHFLCSVSHALWQDWSSSCPLSTPSVSMRDGEEEGEEKVDDNFFTRLSSRVNQFKDNIIIKI